MHIVVSWDVKASGKQWDAINQSLKDQLAPYSWVRPLSTLYIVKVKGEEQRKSLKSALVEVAKSVNETVHVVISPAMSSGTYDGFLPKGAWEKINKRTV